MLIDGLEAARLRTFLAMAERNNLVARIQLLPIGNTEQDVAVSDHYYAARVSSSDCTRLYIH